MSALLEAGSMLLVRGLIFITPNVGGVCGEGGGRRGINSCFIFELVFFRYGGVAG